MSDVFLSYKREERAKVELLAAALKQLGLDVWFDTELVSGDAFPRIINEQLNTAAAIIVCWSKSAVDSDWVQGEAHKAHARGVYVSAKLEPCDPPVPFNAFQDADLVTWSGAWEHEGLRAIVSKLARLTGRPIDQQHSALSAEEASAIEKEIAEQEELSTETDEDEISPAPTPSYVADFVARGTQAGAKELAANLAQVAFEEEILFDERTRWIVAPDELPSLPTRNAAPLTSLKEAIERASPGDTIALLPGVYRGRFRIDKDIRIVGFGHKDARPLLISTGEVAAVDIRANAKLENLVLESRDTGHALCVSGGAPTFVRCLFDRQQLVLVPEGCVHVSGNAQPQFLACTFWSRNCPSIHFAAKAKGALVACDFIANDADSIVLQSRSRPRFERCDIRAALGHAVVSKDNSSGYFEKCAMRASGADVIVHHAGAYSKFVGNRISVKNGSLITLNEAARGLFERNRLEPDPELLVLLEERKRELKKVFKNQDIMRRVIPLPVSATGYHRARFAQNRLPDGSELELENSGRTTVH